MHTNLVEKYMGQLGPAKKWSYPDLTINEALDLVHRIKSVGGTVSQTGLAKMVGIDPRGAGLHSRVQDLKDYGLIEGDGELKLSALGREIADGNLKGVWEAFLNIPLYLEMHQRLGGKEPVDKVSLHNILFMITNAPDDAISRRLARLRNNYIEALQYSPFGAKPETPQIQTFQGQHRSSMTSDPISQLDSPFYLIDKRDTPFFIGLDTPNRIDIAIKYLQDCKESMTGKGQKADRKIKPISLEATIDQ